MLVRLRATLSALAVLGFASCANAPPPQRGDAPTAFVAATPEQGATALAAHDEYLSALTPADVSIRLRGAPAASAADLGRLYASATLAWTDPERQRLGEMVARRRAQLDALAPWLPDTVMFVKGSEAIESGFPHTRGTAIFFGPSLPEPDARLDGLFFHELFHVLSRANRARHDDIYAIIGFARCELEAPPALLDRMLTNPDAPRVEHAAPISEADPSLLVTPLLTANPPRYEDGRTSLGDYFAVEFTALRRGADGRCRPIEDAAYTQDQLREAMLDRVGRNTTYLFHPEEMMAVNFSQMMTGRPAADPWVHERLAELLGVERPPPV